MPDYYKDTVSGLWCIVSGFPLDQYFKVYPVVEIIAFLVLEQNWMFFKGLKLLDSKDHITFGLSMNFSGLSKILGGKFSNNFNYCHPKACILALNQDVYGYNQLNILNSL